MKHGPIALIDENMPVVFLATTGPLYEKVISNIREVKARNGKIIAIVNQLTDDLAKYTDDVVVVPETFEEFSPLINVVPLQLLATILQGRRILMWISQEILQNQLLLNKYAYKKLLPFMRKFY